jgi:hypothetical protein
MDLSILDVYPEGKRCDAKSTTLKSHTEQNASEFLKVVVFHSSIKTSEE